MCSSDLQRRQAPPREKYSDDHRQRDNDGRQSERHELCRRLGGAEPRTRGQSAKNADYLQKAASVVESYAISLMTRLLLGERPQLIQRSTSSPPISTATGTQKWMSRSTRLSQLRDSLREVSIGMSRCSTEA